MNNIKNLESELIELEKVAKMLPNVAINNAAKLQEKYFDLIKDNQSQAMQLALRLFKDGMVIAPETICRLLLQQNPNDLNSLHLLASLASRSGHFEEAIQYLLKCLEIKPDIPDLHFDLATALFQSGNYPPALKECEQLLKFAPEHFGTMSLMAAILVKLGKYDEAIQVYEKLLKTNKDNAEILLRYGVTLRILGRADEAIDAFRNSLELNPELTEAYWNLANLKTYNFDENDIEKMQGLIDSNSLSGDNLSHLSFALGKALEDKQDYDSAFEQYNLANRFYKKKHNYNPSETSVAVERQKSVFTKEFLASHAGAGSLAQDPIFIVGLPRSGSTLLEQILASHSQVDATMELAEITAMVRSLNKAEHPEEMRGYPEIVTKLTNEELKNFGDEYIKRTQIYRKGAQYFIDKTPHNFLHIGLILSILPNAKIIDARRDPMACGFSIYKQQFARGHRFSNDLNDIGLYYQEYLSLMDHWHQVLPNKILTVNYESVVSDFENQVRQLLNFCGLDFEENCLSFYKSKRAVATVSSEQVRQPIYNSALEQWKKFEKHLDPLKNSLNAQI